MDKSEQRIHPVLGDDNERTPKNARRYLVHLKKHLSLPLRVTGIEDFPWEEPYVLGGWDRTARPSRWNSRGSGVLTRNHRTT